MSQMNFDAHLACSHAASQAVRGSDLCSGITARLSVLVSLTPSYDPHLSFLDNVLLSFAVCFHYRYHQQAT